MTIEQILIILGVLATSPVFGLLVSFYCWLTYWRKCGRRYTLHEVFSSDDVIEKSACTFWEVAVLLRWVPMFNVLFITLHLLQIPIKPIYKAVINLFKSIEKAVINLFKSIEFDGGSK